LWPRQVDDGERRERAMVSRANQCMTEEEIKLKFAATHGTLLQVLGVCISTLTITKTLATRHSESDPEIMNKFEEAYTRVDAALNALSDLQRDLQGG
jgi:hypothetical protein